MRAAVLSIGSELLRGDITDRNATFLTRQLAQLGYDVIGVEQFGDDLERLTNAFRRALQHADLVACTGGLGPTGDDLTRDAIAQAVDEEMYEDGQQLSILEERFRTMRRPMVPSNRRQALLIPSAQPISNPNGSAPGWYVRKNGRSVVAMPGPPSEMQPMWHEGVVPLLSNAGNQRLAMLSLVTFGIGESLLEDQIADVIEWRPDVTVATYAKANGVEVHVTARADTDNEAQRLIQEAEQRLRQRIGDSIIGTGDDTLSHAVGRILLEQQLSLACMESATGGALANMITDVSGSSTYFRGGIVAYQRETKAWYGVPEAIMDRHGLVSEETATAMAHAVRRQLATSVGLATTGVAGKESVEGQAPGTVYVAAAIGEATEVRCIRRPGERSAVKKIAAQSALDLLRRMLQPIGTPSK